MAPTKLQTSQRELKATQRRLKVVKHELRFLKRKSVCRVSAVSAPELENHILLLFVGSSKELITLHTGLIPQKTAVYLQARAAIAPFHQLPDDNPGVVKLWRDYLYTGKVHSISPFQASTFNEDAETLDDGMTNESEWNLLAQLYFFAVRLHDEKCTNTVISAFIEKVSSDPEEWHYPTGLASEVWSATGEGDKLRTLLVDLHIWVGKGAGIDEASGYEDRFGPQEFKHAVAMGVLKERKKMESERAKAPWEGDVCRRYHVHVETERSGCSAADGGEMEVVDLTDV